MANKRIKDLTQTATTLASDDYVAIDGSSNGTRKIVKGDLVNDISSQVAGTYLDEANNLSDVASLDTSKLNLEVPDVGTAPNEVPLNGMLGDMAYQSSEGISVGTVEAESLEVTDKITTKDVGGVTKGQVEFQDSGYTISGGSNLGDIRHDAPRHRWYSGATVLAQFDEGTSYFQNTSLGIGTSSPIGPLTVQVAADKNLVTSTQYSGASLEAVNDAYSANIPLAIYGSPIRLLSGNVEVNSGNIVMGSSYGIDFGSTSDGSGAMSSELLDDYEEGTWTPSFSVTSGAFTTMTMDVVCARYVKVGHLVNFYCYIRTNNVNTTGTGGSLIVTGLPYGNAGSNNFPACSVGYAEGWANSPSAGYVVTGGSFIYLTKRNTSITGDLREMTASDMTAGAVTNENQLMLSGSYYSF